MYSGGTILHVYNVIVLLCWLSSPGDIHTTCWYTCAILCCIHYACQLLDTIGYWAFPDPLIWLLLQSFL